MFVKSPSFIGLRPLVLATTLLLVLGTADALAQRGADRGGDRGGWRGGAMGGFGRMMQPDFVRRDLTIIDRELHLDDDQATIVEALLVDYQESFEDGLDEMRAQFTEMREPRSPEDQARREQRRELIQDLRKIRQEFQAERERAGDDDAANQALREKIRARIEPIREQLEGLRGERPSGEQMAQMREQMADLGRLWRTRRDALRAEFLASLQAVLDEEQEALWPPFDRTMRREKTLRDGRLSGERVDLFHLLNEMRLGEENTEPLAGVLEAYASTLDSALVARNEFLETSREALWTAYGSNDTSQAIAIMSQEARLRVAVRDTNHRYADVLATELEVNLGEDPARELRSEFRQRAYGRIYRPTRTQRAFTVARGLEDLDEDVLGALLGLEETYLIDLDIRNAQLIETLRREEPQESERRMRRREARRNGAEADALSDPIRDGFQERDEMGARYRTQLEQMLTPEQVAQLPETRRREGQERGRNEFGQFFRGDRRGGDARGGEGRGRGGRGGEGRGDGRRRNRDGQEDN